MPAENIVTYKPDKQLHMGILAIWKEMFKDLTQSRELIWRLFLRDFQAKYKQSLLGVSWALIEPLITVAVFVFLNRSGILEIKTADIPYPVFALIGLTIWVVFSKGLTACTSSIVSAGSMVVKINFPKISLVIASMGQAVVELLVRVALTGVVLIIFGVVPSSRALLFPLLILPVFFLTLGLGLFLSLLAGLFRDIISLITMVTTYLLFLMPVAYPPPKAGVLALINQWNPLNHIIVSTREVVLSGTIANLNEYIYSCVFCLVLFLVSWRFFHLVQTKIPERI